MWPRKVDFQMHWQVLELSQMNKLNSWSFGKHALSYNWLDFLVYFRIFMLFVLFHTLHFLSCADIPGPPLSQHALYWIVRLVHATVSLSTEREKGMLLGISQKWHIDIFSKCWHFAHFYSLLSPSSSRSLTELFLIQQRKQFKPSYSLINV